MSKVAPMTPADFRQWMKTRRFNIRMAAKWLDMSERQINRWLSGEAKIPHVVAIACSHLKEVRRRV